MKPLIGTDLKRFLRDYRRQHQPDFDIVGLLQSVEYPANVGSIFRVADGANLTELVLTGITPTPPNPTIANSVLPSCSNTTIVRVSAPGSSASRSKKARKINPEKARDKV